MRLRPLLCVGIILVTGCRAFEVGRLVATGSSRSLRERSADAPPSSPAHPALLILAIDGVDRALLYDLLEAGELPGLAALLGGSQGPFAHAYFDRTLVATLPSST